MEGDYEATLNQGCSCVDTSWYKLAACSSTAVQQLVASVGGLIFVLVSLLPFDLTSQHHTATVTAGGICGSPFLAYVDTLRVKG